MTQLSLYDTQDKYNSPCYIKRVNPPVRTEQEKQLALAEIAKLKKLLEEY
jgi:hypothetical protein